MFLGQHGRQTLVIVHQIHWSAYCYLDSIHECRCLLYVTCSLYYDLFNLVFSLLGMCSLYDLMSYSRYYCQRGNSINQLSYYVCTCVYVCAHVCVDVSLISEQLTYSCTLLTFHSNSVTSRHFTPDCWDCCTTHRLQWKVSYDVCPSSAAASSSSSSSSFHTRLLRLLHDTQTSVRG